MALNTMTVTNKELIEKALVFAVALNQEQPQEQLEHSLANDNEDIGTFTVQRTFRLEMKGRKRQEWTNLSITS